MIGFWFLSGTVWHRTVDGHNALCVAAKQWPHTLTVWESPGAPPPYLSCQHCVEALKKEAEKVARQRLEKLRNDALEEAALVVESLAVRTDPWEPEWHPRNPALLNAARLALLNAARLIRSLKREQK